MGLLLRWFLNAIALYLTVAVGHALGLGLGLHSAGSALIAVLVLAIVNALIGTIIRLMTVPINCLTLGLFSIIINALLFWLVGNIQQSGLVVKGFVAALFGSVVFSVLSSLANRYVRSRGERD